jgi:hypothetical protein
MKRRQVWILAAGVVALIPVLAMAQAGPTRVRLDNADAAGSVRPIGFEQSMPVYAMPVQYRPSGYVGTPEIVSHVGEVLGAIDNSDDRNRLAQQWLQFSQTTIAKDQQMQEQWLQLQQQQLVQQQQQLAQQQEAEQLRLQLAQLQMRLEELRAQNLRLEQQLGQGSGVGVPRPPTPTPTPQ